MAGETGPDVKRIGPFVQLRVDYTTRWECPHDQSSAGHAGSYTVYLVEVQDEWRIIDVGGWVT